MIYYIMVQLATAIGKRANMSIVGKYEKAKALGRALVYALLTAVVPAVVMVLICAAAGIENATPNIRYLSAFTGYAFLIFALGRRCEKRGIAFAEAAFWQPRHLNIKNAARLFAAGFGFGMFVSGLLSVLPLPEETINEYAEQSSSVVSGTGTEFIISLLFAFAVAPIVEEFFYRGFILSELSRNMNRTISAVLASLLFAAAHGHIYWMIYAFVMGLLFSYMALEYRNIAYTIPMHIGFNSTSLLIMLLNCFEIELGTIGMAVFTFAGLVIGCVLFYCLIRR